VKIEVVKMLKRGSARELAELLGISERRVNQLVNEEVLHREIEGDFVLTMAIASFYENKYSSKDEDDYWSEKALHEAAKRKLAELELARRQNLSHDAAGVERVMTDMLSKLRSQLLGIPSKMAARLENQSRSVIMTELSKEIKSRLTELSDYNPEIFSNEEDS
jgi:hypothetical protein